MKKGLILSVALVLSLQGCFIAASITKTMKSWEGAYVADLVASWGPPQQVFSDGQGGQVLVYANTRITGYKPATATTQTTGNAYVQGNRIYGQATSTTVYDPAQLYGYTSYRVFFVNGDGHIYRWAWKGL